MMEGAELKAKYCVMASAVDGELAPIRVESSGSDCSNILTARRRTYA